MRTDGLLQLRYKQFSVVILKPVKRFKHVRRRQVELVKHDPVAFANSLHERSLLEHELTCEWKKVASESVSLASASTKQMQPNVPACFRAANFGTQTVHVLGARFYASVRRRKHVRYPR